MKSLLFYTDTHILGGTEQQMFLLAQNLPVDEFSITLACSNSTSLNAWCQRWIESGFRVIRLNVIHKHDPRHFFYIRNLAKEFDLVHLHLWNPASCRLALAGIRHNIPIIVTEHDPFELNGIKNAIKKTLIKKADRMIVASHASESIVKKEYPRMAHKVRVVYNGIDVNAWQQAAIQTDEISCERKTRAPLSAETRGIQIRETEFNADEKTAIILCVAELNERKGQRFLLEAARIMRAQKKSVAFKIFFAGDGPAKKCYKNLSWDLFDCVSFLGKRRDVAPLMLASDIFVLPSKREAFGLVLLEAAALGKPIVASDVGGIKEIIQNGLNGILIPPENPVALADALLCLIENKKRAYEMGQNASATVSTAFSAEKMALKTAAIYNEALNEKHS